jgi:uncharacterized protein YdhG (YjbR/CyaY superfamily)
MNIKAKSVEEYIKALPEDKKEGFIIIRNIINENIPEGFSEEISYGMIGYVVPLEKFSEGYRNDKKAPLPLINLGVQKSHIALYHSGIYADKDLSEWFISEYKKETGKKPDMGKSCIRFKNSDKIPTDLMKKLLKKINLEQWINTYKKLSNK